MKRIFLDIGHGSDTRENGGGKFVVKPNGEVFEEHDFNSNVAIVIKEKLEKLDYKVDLFQQPHSPEIGLRERTRFINSEHQKEPYLIVISLHANASNNKDAHGFGIFHWHNDNDGKTFAEIWAKHAQNDLDIGSWGQAVWKSIPNTWSNFHIIRESVPVAVLIEFFFFTNFAELEKCYTPEYIEKFADVTVKAVQEYDALMNAELKLTPIMGTSSVLADQLKSFLLANNKNPKISCPVEEFCQMWIEESVAEGIKPEVAFAQACYETGFFNYGGIVLPQQNNYGGIGAVNGSKQGSGAHFDSPRIGIRASIQHLKAYASKSMPEKEVVDPRFSLVNRGSAVHVEELSGKWAYPGFSKSKYSSLQEARKAKDSYGDNIVKLADLIMQTKIIRSAWEKEVEEACSWALKNKISDCKRLDDPVTRKEVIAMLYRLKK